MQASNRQASLKTHYKIANMAFWILVPLGILVAAALFILSKVGVVNPTTALLYITVTAFGTMFLGMKLMAICVDTREALKQAAGETGSGSESTSENA